MKTPNTNTSNSKTVVKFITSKAVLLLVIVVVIKAADKYEASLPFLNE